MFNNTFAIGISPLEGFFRFSFFAIIVGNRSVKKQRVSNSNSNFETASLSIVHVQKRYANQETII